MIAIELFGWKFSISLRAFPKGAPLSYTFHIAFVHVAEIRRRAARSVTYYEEMMRGNRAE